MTILFSLDPKFRKKKDLKQRDFGKKKKKGYLGHPRKKNLCVEQTFKLTLESRITCSHSAAGKS